MSIPVEVRGWLDGDPATIRVAIVGATKVREKFGNKILRDLATKGFDVIPIHPREAEIEGRRAYASVADVPGHVHIVDFVLPPKLSTEVTEALDPAKVGALWYQPGAFDADTVAAAARFAHVVAGPCIMVET